MPPSQTPSTVLPPAIDPAVRSSLPWQTEIARNLRYHWFLKFAGIFLFMSVFFTAYFHVLRHPAAAVTVMPLTALDLAVPFAPGALWIYVSLWLYVGIAPGLMPTLRKAAVYGLWAAGLCGTGLLLFYWFPTAVPPPSPPIDATRHFGFAMLQGVDAAGNACPSLHVATAVFTSAWIARLLKDARAPAVLQWINAVWMVAIVWSTLATRQHVALDATAGAALGAVYAWASLRWR